MPATTGAVPVACSMTFNRAPLPGAVPRAIGAIIDVNDAPLTGETLAIGAAVARAAAVVYVENRDAAAGPILDGIFQ